jgi:PAS domain S-box-containing protein
MDLGNDGRPNAPATKPRRVGAVTLHASDNAQTYHEKLARIVLDEMYQFVGLLDAQGMTLEINRAALEGAGVRLDDIRGKPFWEARWFAVSQETVQAQKDFVRRAQLGEFIRCDVEVYGKAAGEETIIVDFSLLPVKDDSGAVVFLLAEGRNITEKKGAEAEIARKNAELQSLLERIRQLDQLKNDLFANVSHELRTPLALILGSTDEMLAQGAALSEPQARSLTVIRRNAIALLRQVNDLLDLAKLDARKVVLNYSRADLASLARVVAEQFRPIAAQRNVAYVIETPQALDAEVDLEKTERVFLNLLSNAFKFTPPGGRIRCALERVGSHRARWVVQDSGPGVAPEMQQSIFERFRQVQHGTTRDVGGTGLGLAITKEFVELHCGVIGVTAAPGGGALFQMEIPRMAPPGAIVGGAPSLAAAQSNVSSEGTVAELLAADADAPEDARRDGRPTALVVEDNAEMRRFVREALAGEFRVIAAADGQQALERAMTELPDIVVTDLMLPRLGGDRLVDEMRVRPSLADVPVLVLSAKDDEALRTRLLDESVQDYVTKPFSVHELRARVRNLTSMKLARDLLRREVASQSKDLAELTGMLVASRRSLQESEHRWWAIYEHSPVGIALADAQGQFRAANPAFRALLGRSEDDMHACSLQQITPAEDRAATEAHVQSLMAGEVRDYPLQRRFQRKDGGMVWANTSVSQIPGEPDAAPLLVVVAEDITRQKAAQEALARARHELARVTRVSTLGELAASIAHEVNQPLAAIAANGHACARWLNADPPDPREAQAAAQRIVRDANRASEVIARIRAFLRRGEIRRELIEIDSVIADVLALVRSEVQALRIALRHPPGRELPRVLADRVQVQQVVLNLVMNALEAIGRSTALTRTVDIRAHHRAAEGLQIDVRDSGCGIDASASDRLFDAFHTTKPQGLGMGLAISRSIVEAHGGRLWVRPNEGAGVTFSFTLPVEPVALTTS